METLNELSLKVTEQWHSGFAFITGARDHRLESHKWVSKVFYPDIAMLLFVPMYITQYHFISNFISVCICGIYIFF
jgi:hypothetical protein